MRAECSRCIAQRRGEARVHTKWAIAGTRVACTYRMEGLQMSRGPWKARYEEWTRPRIMKELESVFETQVRRVSASLVRGDRERRKRFVQGEIQATTDDTVITRRGR